eukprot:gb/GEZN01003346.1/.p1 GENE.gb/GEZN01003346.1/~~gb/GEZN01003346.1/.p1  ORF type:complete len:656 (+),score=119.16 gb/GEZN01003346.1/:43-1968(+)
MEDEIIGIAIGSLYSRVAVLQNDKAVVVADSQGNHETPSVVAWTSPTDVLVGHLALAQGSSSSANVVFNPMAMLGRTFSELSSQKQWPLLTCADAKKDRPGLTLAFSGADDVTVSPEVVCSHLIARLKQTAEDFLGKPVQAAVVTVPAVFSPKQREAFKASAAKANLQISFLSEPVAAALSRGLDAPTDNDAPKWALVVDLGGAGLTLSLLRVQRGLLALIASHCEPKLAGSRFDAALVEHLAAEFQSTHKKDPRTHKRAMWRLHAQAELAKRTLSNSPQAAIQLDAFVSGIDFFTNVSRVRFQSLVGEQVRALQPAIELFLSKAQVPLVAVKTLVLVGGISLVPCIRNAVLSCLGDCELPKPLAHISPEEASVLGAVLQAMYQKQAVGCGPPPPVLGLSRPIAVRSVLGLAQVILPKGTVPPCTAQLLCSALPHSHKEDKLSLCVEVLEGESLQADQNQVLGCLTFPLDFKKGKLSFALDAQGCLSVTCEGSTSKLEIKTTTEKTQAPKQQAKTVDAGALWRMQSVSLELTSLVATTLKSQGGSGKTLAQQTAQWIHTTHTLPSLQEVERKLEMLATQLEKDQSKSQAKSGNNDEEDDEDEEEEAAPIEEELDGGKPAGEEEESEDEDSEDEDALEDGLD